MKTCSVPTCKQRHHSHGYCRTHARRWQAHGDPEGGKAIKGYRERFLREALKSDTDSCIEWPYSRAGLGYDRGAGYGVLTINGKQIGAHRLICEWAHGVPPKRSYAAAHRCGKSYCVNPRHLYWATAKENAQDKLRHGTNNDGERHGLSKLSNEKADEIRELARSGIKQADLARQFNLSPMTISRLVRGESYRR